MSDEEKVLNNLQPTMTDENVEELYKTLEDNINNSKELSEVREAMNTSDEDTPVETGEYRMVNTIVDPATGLNKVVNSEDVSESLEDDSFEALLEKDLNFDIDQSPISLDEIVKFLNTTKDDPIIQTELGADISTEELSSLLELANKYKNKERIDSLFNKLPKTFQNFINKNAGDGLENTYSSSLNGFRNTMAEALLEEVVTSIDMERASNSVNSGIEKIFNKATEEIGDTIVGYTKERNEKYRNYINENVEDPERKENALKLLDNIESSANLTELKEFCKKCKIRKIDVERPQDRKNKDIEFILNKYNNNTDVNIYDIFNAQQVLERNINKEDTNYTPAHCRAFLIAFSKYCMNFSVTNVEQHIFMFYTIYNILIIDINKGKNADISEKFLDNVRECIDNLIQCNSFLATK